MHPAGQFAQQRPGAGDQRTGDDLLDDEMRVAVAERLELVGGERPAEQLAVDPGELVVARHAEMAAVVGEDRRCELRPIGEQLEEGPLLDRPGLDDDAVEVEGDRRERPRTAAGWLAHRPATSDRRRSHHSAMATSNGVWTSRPVTQVRTTGWQLRPIHHQGLGPSRRATHSLRKAQTPWS